MHWMVILMFQPGTPNPTAGLNVVDLEEALNGKPHTIELEPLPDLLKR
jgi:hypothetical protein